MKALFFASLLIASSAFADQLNCKKPQDQYERNICSGKEATKSLDSLTKKVISFCRNQDEVLSEVDGSLYSQMLNECVSNKAKQLNKTIVIKPRS